MERAELMLRFSQAMKHLGEMPMVNFPCLHADMNMNVSEVCNPVCECLRNENGL